MADQLKLATTVLSGAADYYGGAAKRSAGRFVGQQYRGNVKRRLIAGEREAAQYRQAGTVAASNAAAAMAAQGGVVDSEMLARMKRDADIDAISAMFDAKADALTSGYAARQAEREGEREYRAGVIRMGSSLLGAASTFGRGAGLKSSRPVKTGAPRSTLRTSGSGKQYYGGF
jgi:hypothetical protein